VGGRGGSGGPARRGSDGVTESEKSPRTSSGRRMGTDKVRTTLPGVPASSITIKNPPKRYPDQDELFEAALRWQKKNLSSPGSGEPPEEN